MTDYRSIEILQVFKSDAHVANLQRLPKGCRFDYVSEFLSSSEPAIALHLPKNLGGIQVEGLANLPTYFAGILPEGVMFNAVRRLIGSAADDLFAVLAATGAEAIGDIDVRVPGETPRKHDLTLKEAIDEMKSLLSGGKKASVEDVSAIAGVQPKLSLGQLVRASRKSVYIAKFESPEFSRLIENELSCMRLAHRCGLDVSSVNVESGVLVVKRFDRKPGGVKVHVEDMCQVMDMFPNSKYSMEYADLLRAMARLGVSKATLLNALRLYVFSYIIGNGDLHAKNVSLVFDGGQWRLSPAYDLLSTLPYASLLDGAERMALDLRDESFGRFSAHEFVELGAVFGLPEKAVVQMIEKTASRALAYASKFVGSLGILPEIESRAKSLT